MRDLFLGVDVGTYSSKAVVADAAGVVVDSATVPHGVDIPRPGWAEQDADEVWWSDVVRLCRVLFDERLDARRVAGVGVSAIGPCALPVGLGGDPLRPGILYGVDTRAVEQIASLEAEIGREEIRGFSAFDLSAQAIGPKIAWLRENEPGVWARTAKVLTASSYLVHRLTGEYVTDHHQAAHVAPLYDAHSQTWSDRYSDLVCDLSYLPPLDWPDRVAGSVTADAAEATGLVPGTPVSVGTVDALAEAVSVGVGEAGDLMVMYGSTAFFILATEGLAVMEGGWPLPGAVEGSSVLAAGMATTGSLTRWFVDEFYPDQTTDDAYDAAFAAAAEVPPGSEGLLVLPYFSGERTPINDPRARGVIAGLSLKHTRAHVFRAILEGVALGVTDNIEAMDAAAGVGRLVAVGGGVEGGLLTQIVSDVSGRTQEIPEVTVGAAYGDALLAARAVGAVPDLGAWRRPPAATLSPGVGANYADLRRDYKELYMTTRDVVHRLGGREVRG